jgi:hypothetical protein
MLLTDKLMLLARVQSSSKRLQYGHKKCVFTKLERCGTVCDTPTSLASNLKIAQLVARHRDVEPKVLLLLHPV